MDRSNRKYKICEAEDTYRTLVYKSEAICALAWQPRDAYLTRSPGERSDLQLEESFEIKN